MHPTAPDRSHPRMRVALLLTALLCALASGPANAQISPAADGFNPVANEEVLAMALEADGSVLMGGRFTRVGGVNRRHLARVGADGSLDAAFNPNPNDVVHDVVVQPDGKILVAGAFTQIGGGARPFLARLNEDGSRDTTFTPPALAGECRALLLLADGSVVVGGIGVYAVLTPTGAIAPGFTSPVNPGARIYALAEHDGAILIGGLLSVPRLGLARVSVAGVADPNFNAQLTDERPVHSIAVTADDKIYIGGAFELVGAERRPFLARLNPTGSLDAGFQQNENVGIGFTEDGFFGAVRALVVQEDGGVLAAGDVNFPAPAGQAFNHVARFNQNGVVGVAYNARVNGVVHAMIPHPGDRVLIGGAFTQAGGLTRTRAARLAGNVVLSQVTISPTAMTVDEPDGTATFTVELSDALPVPVTIPVTYGGTATNNRDYRRPPSPLRFAAGQTTLDLVLEIIDDDIEEPDETVIITLGNPPDPALARGNPFRATLTIVSDDTRPSITLQPTPQIARSGDPVTFTADADGTPPPVLGWFRANRAVPGADTTTLNSPSVSLADAGNYQFRASRGGFTARSNNAALVVVDSTSSVVPAVEGGRAVLRARAAGPGRREFHWRKNGVLIDAVANPRFRGVQTANLTITNVQLSDDDTYACDVTNSDGTEVTGDFELLVYNAPPALDVPVETVLNLPPAMVSEDYTFDLPMVNDRLRTATAFVITGLPRGLRFDRSTGRIFGRPLVAGTFDRIRITPRNLAGPGVTVAASITVIGLPDGTIGRWVGLIDGGPNTSNGLGGEVNFTISRTGVIAGFLRAGAERRAFREVLDTAHPAGINPGFGDPRRIVRVNRGRNQPAWILEVNLNPAAGFFGGTLAREDLVETVSVVGYFVTAPDASMIGLHTHSLRLANAVDETDDTLPQGRGILSARVARNGTVRVTGRSADDAPVTTSTFTSSANTANLFVLLYRNTGSLRGVLELFADPLNPGPAETMVWTKLDQTVIRPQERSYRDGFMVPVRAPGSLYQPPPDRTTPVLGLAPPPSNARLTFTRAGIAAADTDPSVTFNLGSGPRGQFPVGLGYPINVSVNRGNGVFNGVFTLREDVNGVRVQRRVVYRGILHHEGGVQIGVGFFNMAALPGVGEPANSTPILSGLVTLGAP
jgi:uncharacterized delta-60 repeat protein